MKAITLLQPWAQLVALRAKRYDPKTWYTNYRGRLAIHASLEFPKAARRLCRCEPFASALLGNEELPLGCVIAICDLAAVVPTAPADGSLFEELHEFPASELPFGDFRPGLYAWHYSNVRALENPVPARGARSLWDWDETSLGLDLNNLYHMKKNAPQIHQPQQYRQGDVFIERVESLPSQIKALPLEDGRAILAHGEVTGHAHEISEPKVATLHEMKEAVRLLGDLAGGAVTEAGLILTEDSSVIHQEHATIPLEAGKFVVRRQREYSPEGLRNVAD